LISGEAVAVAAPAAGACKRRARSDAEGARRFPALVDLLAQNGKPHLAQQLHDYAGLVRYEPPELVIRPAKPCPAI
jgi:DNA polymerase-3 subunit gamma/tau